MNNVIRNFGKKINLNSAMLIYMIIYAVAMLFLSSLCTIGLTGEGDDYTLPVASILNRRSFNILPEDVAYYKKLFPRWSEWIDAYSLSGYIAKGGGEMPWYFPIYAICCIPFTVFLKFLNFPTEFAFPYTNIMVICISFIVLVKCLKRPETEKALLLAILSVNPIIFYFNWTSAETFIYAMLIIACVAWYNKWYKRAAIFVSLAGMLNPTIMSIGIIMIIHYMLCWIKGKEEKISWGLYIKGSILKIFSYGMCYIIGIIPMIYNYYNMGHINLTASHSEYLTGRETILERLLAYLLDLNYGIIAYYPLLLIVAALLSVVAIKNKKVDYIIWGGTFLINMLLYSIITHINCAMSGIARYNVWGVVLLIFGVCLCKNQLVHKIKFKRIINALLVVGVFWTMCIVLWYGPNVASNTQYTSFTPLAEYVLDKAPGIYNPLHSTFSSRINHVDGGYDYETPIVYTASDGYIRKVLASKKDQEYLMDNYVSCTGDNKWWKQKVHSLTEKESYISVPPKYAIEKLPSYNIGEELLFGLKNYNAGDYIISGMSEQEDWGTWTDGREMIMRFQTSSDSDVLVGKIKCSVYNEKQKILIYVNGKTVYNNEFEGGALQFSFSNPGKGEVIEIRIELPNAISPSVFGANDQRLLGLGITTMVFEDDK